jgi:hypothetical protein
MACAGMVIHCSWYRMGFSSVEKHQELVHFIFGILCDVIFSKTGQQSKHICRCQNCDSEEIVLQLKNVDRW